MKFEQFSALIKMGQDQTFNLGTPDTAPSRDWIESAEVALGHAFPPSYLEFLARHGGGEIHGDEIFSIYGIPFDQVVGGDIVYQTKKLRSDGRIGEVDVAICVTGFGEIFVLDSTSAGDDREYEVIRIVGKEREWYAPSFVDFLLKFSAAN